MSRFDVIVIGAGPGGIAAATRGTLKGLKVGLANGQSLGGYGIHGAYKSKGMYELAKDHLVATKPGRGYLPAPSKIDFSQVQIQLMQGSTDLENLYKEQIGLLGITEIKGFASFVDPHTISVEGACYQADKIIIATGSHPRWPPGIQRDGKLIMSSDEVVSLTHLPESLLILGAGVIGCEFASIFNSFGCEITLVDICPAIMSHEDDDIVAFLTENFQTNDIKVLPSSRLESMEVVDDRVVTVLQDGTEIETEMVLVSVGRIPSSADLNLDAAGVVTNDRGYISVNDNCQTNVEHIYSVGDVSQRETNLVFYLVHVAEAEGHLAIHHIITGDDPLPLDHIPFIIFTIPLIAGAGENEKTAKKKYGEPRVARLNNVRNHRAHAMRSCAGFVKLIVGPVGDDRVLGVRVCGPQADTLIGEISLCIQHNLPYTSLVDAIHAHPSLSESLHNVARILAGLYPVQD